MDEEVQQRGQGQEERGPGHFFVLDEVEERKGRCEVGDWSTEHCFCVPDELWDVVSCRLLANTTYMLGPGLILCFASSRGSPAIVVLEYLDTRVYKVEQ